MTSPTHAKSAAAKPQGPSAEQKRLVRESFAAVEPIAEQAAALFYGRLFEIDPSVKPLFKGDIEEQGKKLMSTIKIAVASLDKIETLVPTLKLLGTKHRDLGVENKHYDTVAGALLWTLEKGLGPKFTPATKDAWVAVYTLLAGVMKGA